MTNMNLLIIYSVESKQNKIIVNDDKTFMEMLNITNDFLELYQHLYNYPLNLINFFEQQYIKYNFKLSDIITNTYSLDISKKNEEYHNISNITEDMWKNLKDKFHYLSNFIENSETYIIQKLSSIYLVCGIIDNLKSIYELEYKLINENFVKIFTDNDIKFINNIINKSIKSQDLIIFLNKYLYQYKLIEQRLNEKLLYNQDILNKVKENSKIILNKIQYNSNYLFIERFVPIFDKYILLDDNPQTIKDICNECFYYYREPYIYYVHLPIFLSGATILKVLIQYYKKDKIISKNLQNKHDFLLINLFQFNQDKISSLCDEIMKLREKHININNYENDLNLQNNFINKVKPILKSILFLEEILKDITNNGIFNKNIKEMLLYFHYIHIKMKSFIISEHLLIHIQSNNNTLCDTKRANNAMNLIKDIKSINFDYFSYHFIAIIEDVKYIKQEFHDYLYQDLIKQFQKEINNHKYCEYIININNDIIQSSLKFNKKVQTLNKKHYYSDHKKNKN